MLSLPSTRFNLPSVEVFLQSCSRFHVVRQSKEAAGVGRKGMSWLREEIADPFDADSELDFDRDAQAIKPALGPGPRLHGTLNFCQRRRTRYRLVCHGSSSAEVGEECSVGSGGYGH